MTREQQQRTKIKICGLKRQEDITYVNKGKTRLLRIYHRISKKQQKRHR